ncbi:MULTISPECIES: pirin family protein [Betaproteobacteria]|jgi:redox-sensitive bicupin YhaK (pirin superfamily)|uniref:Pirin family protein n=1 Tax=Thauera sinica TaxID=2665146 RepID=A0ABW1AYZ3_9RHOO|nr:pirin family protein [Thauera sp. K11]ATE60622.1 pirin [Thauera sp. K11]ATE62855.1 pirin [Thauera sp. K11]TXH16140.1 MAG: pirin family protein [Gammaproteobacteria bacterium]
MNIGSGFRAYSLRGGEMAAPIDPFLGVDHAWMSAATFPTHPHAGFSAVSYLFLDSESGVNNRDSLGTRNLIQPGGLHWTAAGRGVVHSEVPAESGKTVHMLQIFVNLAVERQGAEAFALSLEPQDVPVVHLPGIKVRVPLGAFGEARSPLRPPTEVCLLDISLDEGASLSVPIPDGHSVFIMPIFGTLVIDGQSFAANEPRLPVFPAQATLREIALQAKDGNAKVVVFSGTPLRQPVHWQGPMALASAETLADRIAAYQRGEFGSI